MATNPDDDDSTEQSTTPVYVTDVDVDLEDVADPVAELRAAIIKMEEHPPAVPWIADVTAHVDAEIVERYRPAFEQAVADGSVDLYEFIVNEGHQDPSVTFAGYDPEYYLGHNPAPARAARANGDVTAAVRSAIEDLAKVDDGAPEGQVASAISAAYETLTAAADEHDPQAETVTVEAAERLSTIIERLQEFEDAPADEWGLIVRETLADLAVAQSALEAPDA
jgi:hypothetical protein